MSKDIKFVDTTIRDGQASIWAMNMATRHLTPIMPLLDKAGFDAIEFVAPASRFKKFVRDLREDPWDWIHWGVKLAQNTSLRWHSDMSGLKMLNAAVPDAIGELLFRRIVDLGITSTRTGNNWNNFAALDLEVKRLAAIGMSAVVHVMYTVSPVHSDEYFVQKAVEAAGLKPERLCFKDVSGLLTPERTRTLLTAMMAKTPSFEWEFHGHCNNGLGPLNALEAARCGVKYIHTSLPPLANGASQPSLHNMASNLAADGFRPDIDLSVLDPAVQFLHYTAAKERWEIGTPKEPDLRLYEHQIPGGMISSLVFQLKKIGLESRLEEVLEEVPIVRADFGYPIMVTPLSQIVGTQSVLNVVTGVRYGEVTDETIHFALGWHGGVTVPQGMNQDVLSKILDRFRAQELTKYNPDERSLQELRREYGAHLTDEKLILHVLIGAAEVEALPETRLGSVGLSKNWQFMEIAREAVRAPRGRSVYVMGDRLGIRVKSAAPTDSGAS